MGVPYLYKSLLPPTHPRDLPLVKRLSQPYPRLPVRPQYQVGTQFNNFHLPTLIFRAIKHTSIILSSSSSQTHRFTWFVAGSGYKLMSVWLFSYLAARCCGRCIGCRQRFGVWCVVCWGLACVCTTPLTVLTDDIHVTPSPHSHTDHSLTHITLFMYHTPTKLPSSTL